MLNGVVVPSWFVSVAIGFATYLGTGLAMGRRPEAAGSDRFRRWQDHWRSVLAQADLPARPARLAACSATSAAVVTGVTQIALGIPALSTVFGPLAAGLPILYVLHRRSQVQSRRIGSWPEALRDLGASLRSGHSLHRSLLSLAEDGPPPLRPALSRYPVLAASIDPGTALDTVRRDLADPLSDRVVEVLLVAQEQGTALVVDVLDDLADATVEDLELRSQIEVAQLETRMEAWIASGLPFGVLVLLCLGSEQYQAFYQGPAGSAVILLGALLCLVGLLAVGRLAAIPHEPRLLGRGER